MAMSALAEAATDYPETNANDENPPRTHRGQGLLPLSMMRRRGDLGTTRKWSRARGRRRGFDSKAQWRFFFTNPRLRRYARN